MSSYSLPNRLSERSKRRTNWGTNGTPESIMASSTYFFNLNNFSNSLYISNNKYGVPRTESEWAKQIVSHSNCDNKKLYINFNEKCRLESKKHTLLYKRDYRKYLAGDNVKYINIGSNNWEGDDIGFLPPMTNKFASMTYAEAASIPSQRVTINKAPEVCLCKYCKRTRNMYRNIALKKEERQRRKALIKEDIRKDRAAYFKWARTPRRTYVDPSLVWTGNYISTEIDDVRLPYLDNKVDKVPIVNETYSSNHVPRRHRHKWYPLNVEEGTYVPKIKAQRNVLYLYNIRKLRLLLREKQHLNNSYVEYWDQRSDPRNVNNLPKVLLADLPVVQMEASDAPVLKQTSTSNVVVEEIADSNDAIIGSSLGNLRRYCEADINKPVAQLTREIPFHTFTWTDADTYGKEMAELGLPFDALYTSEQNPADKKQLIVKNKMNAMSLPLLQYQYLNCDMKIRASVSSPQFLAGRLIMAWRYHDECDANSARRRGLSNLSSSQSVVLNPSEDSDGVIYVPYRSHKSYMNTRCHAYQGIPVTIGTLIIKVLSPLVGKIDCGQGCTVTLFLTLINPRTMGMIHPTLSIGNINLVQMMSVPTILKAASQLYQAYADSNRDLPPNPSHSNTLIPLASNNICVGRNAIEPVHSMRLDALGQTPHPEDNLDEMTVKYISRQFGLINRVEWKAGSPAGTKLFCCDAAPIAELSVYKTETYDGTICYALPPVAVISQLYAYWRGCLEFKIDVVATKFHSGKLHIAWVPNYLGEVSHVEAKSCASNYFEIGHGVTSMTVVTPFMSDRPYWPHRFSTGIKGYEYKAPGKFCVYINNVLRCSQGTSDTIYMLLYVRAHTNFEVAVPCQPTIGLCYNASFRDETDQSVAARAGYFPYYAGVWVGSRAEKKLLLRYGPGIGHVAQFDSLTAYGPGYFKFKEDSIAQTMIYYTTRGSRLDGRYAYIVPYDEKDGYGRIYAGICQSSAKVIEYFYELDKEGKYTLREDYDLTKLIDWDESTAKNTYYSPGTVNPILSFTSVARFSGMTESQAADEMLRMEGRPPADAQGVADEAPNIVFLEAGSDVTVGSTQFGETFMDLKDLCRRYQYYTTFSCRNNGTEILEGTNYQFPVMPQGLLLDESWDSAINRIRDGPIPIILSGFRFFRGGLRLKFMPTTTDIKMYTVQIKPDRLIDRQGLTFGGGSPTDNLWNHGYASTFSVTAVNPILTVEVPYYIPGPSGLLLNPNKYALGCHNANQACTLGTCCVQIIGAQTEKVENVMTVLYAVADDFHAHTFQGFPPMVFIAEADK